MRRLRGESGLSLIETMVSIFIFSIMTLGITPLLVSSMKGSSLSRSQTVAKNLASEAMERFRGLPFFESVKNQTNPKRVDALDLLFPDLVAGAGGSGYNATSRTFTTICTSSSKLPSANGTLACPHSLTAGQTMTVTARFVAPGPVVDGKQTYVAALPKTGYSWSSTATETAPSNLLELTIAMRWSLQGENRDYELRTLLGDRQLAPDRLRASARIDYIVQASTSYRDNSGRLSSLVGTVGALDSSVSSRAVTAAEQTVRAGRFTLTREESGTTDGTVLSDIVSGERVLKAPANQLPTANVNSVASNITHPDLSNTQIGSVDQTQVEGSSTGAEVVNELPRAIGKFAFNGSGANTPSFAMDNQKKFGDQTSMRLASEPVLGMERGTSGGARIRGESRALATAQTPAGSRKVEGYAKAEFSGMFLFPTSSTAIDVTLRTFVNDTTERRAVLAVRGFTAEVTCLSKPGGAQVAGTWSATLKYWRDNNNNGFYDGSYVTVPLSGEIGGAATDPLASIGNPLVHDGLLPIDDVYLFNKDGKSGYLESLTSNPVVSSSESSDGRTTEVAIKDAIQIITYMTDPANPATSLNISVGNLSCRAVDRRGL